VSVALARLLEWRRRDPASALGVVEAAQGRMPEEARALEPRRERLRHKLERRRRQQIDDLFGERNRQFPR
jgi:hypothetical protein